MLSWQQIEPREENIMSNNKLTPEQVDQLVEAIKRCALSCWTALRSGPRFSPEQQQKLVDGAAKDTVFAAAVLTDVPWLTEPQRAQLKLVS